MRSSASRPSMASRKVHKTKRAVVRLMPIWIKCRPQLIWICRKQAMREPRTGSHSAFSWMKNTRDLFSQMTRKLMMSLGRPPSNLAHPNRKNFNHKATTVVSWRVSNPSPPPTSIVTYEKKYEIQHITEIIQTRIQLWTCTSTWCYRSQFLLSKNLRRWYNLWRWNRLKWNVGWPRHNSLPRWNTLLRVFCKRQT